MPRMGYFLFAHINRVRQIELYIPAFLGITERFHQLAVSPPAGKQQLTLTDEQGNAVSRGFEIIDK